MDFDSQGNVKYLCSFSSVSGTIQGTLCVYLFFSLQLHCIMCMYYSYIPKCEDTDTEEWTEIPKTMQVIKGYRNQLIVGNLGLGSMPLTITPCHWHQG